MPCNESKPHLQRQVLLQVRVRRVQPLVRQPLVGGRVARQAQQRLPHRQPVLGRVFAVRLQQRQQAAAVEGAGGGQRPGGR